ncbi:UDP-glucose/GDP-mannose dehydrogenase family protein [Xylanibacillus composti]|uniref:UDP-glucose 6-dehydrogenase n=1 Tax=Xylanibacillus composti TaxID=1572762 RepID=A0A8J4H592_9BACL|nr:UDP-glucose/GDP-mannose dehydrogenase family protein [Xylanibacillus composti]MDT9724514.1 UDP-glucose/GDP-mannose dehydrogenase family protein [Xylanibacillus composti]GIQ69777.1 UDP-glucose 6-dehydrogenase [Xylanibacillus composti]
MNLAVIGTGYVGLVTGVCFSDIGHRVTCVDKDAAKVEKLRAGQSPIYEPGLEELIRKNMNEGRLHVTTDLESAVEEAEIVVLAVGTPQSVNGEANLQYIEQAAREVATAMNGYKIIVVKSTVPVGTNERIAARIGGLTEHPFDVVSVPEFLREGSAIKDTFHPDRIVIGAASREAAEKIKELHQPLTTKMMLTDLRSAEMIKYASNAFLATKISFINEIANLCELVGADVAQVAQGMGYDRRIGDSFLNAGVGYGGSCFPKDTQALIQIAGNVNYDFKLLRSVVEVNKNQRFNVFNQLVRLLNGLHHKTVGVWGLSFKPNTDDVRDAPSLEIVGMLLASGAKVKIYDPVAMERFCEMLNDPSVICCSSASEAASNSDAVCLLTEWDEFRHLDLKHIASLMRQPILVDGRNVYTAEDLNGAGLIYRSVGRPMLSSPVQEEENVSALQA